MSQRSYKHYNPGTFLHDILQFPWSVIEAFSNVNDKLNAFNLLFNDIFDQHAALKPFRVRGKPNPLVTNNIRALLRERNSWRRRAKRTNYPMPSLAYKTSGKRLNGKLDLQNENLSPIRYKVILETPIVSRRLFVTAFQEYSAETIKRSLMS